MMAATAALDEYFYDDRIRSLSAYINGDEENLDVVDLERPLGLSDGELCLVVDHDGLTEYVALGDDLETYVSVVIREGGGNWGPTELDRRDLETRIGKSIDVRRRKDVQVDFGGGR